MIADLMGSKAVDREVAALAMRTVWPLLQKAKLGRFERPAGAQYDVAKFDRAVSAATGKRVKKVRTLWQGDVFSAAAPEIRYGSLVDFNSSLAVALYDTNWEKLKGGLIARFSYERYLDVHESVWDCVRREVAQPLGFQFWDNAFEGAISSSGESLATAIYYLLAQALVGDRDGVERMSGLIRLLPQWIPVGEIKKEPGTWLAVASSA